MINNQENQEKDHIETIKDSPKNKSRVTIEYQFDAEKDKLGIGGYGEVYKVRKKRVNMSQNDPEYALKIFNKINFYKENDKGSRILTEIKIQRSLNHEHIVKYEHSFEDKKNVYILMEYCGYGTLASMIKTRKHLEEYEIRYYMFQVLSVLKYFRREKIVHRDLTLGNIFLKDKKTVKIGDFGFAYKESENEEKAGVICGTPGYYTPESNNSKYSYKTDIFDFGVCIYYLFGGKHLFKNSLESADFFTSKEELTFERKLNFSEEAKNLLNSTITIESQRIDLDKIYNHPFFNCGKGLSKDDFPEFNESNRSQILKELPKKLGLILTHRGNESNNNKNNIITHNPQNINITPSESQNSNTKTSNDSFNVFRNTSGQSGKNVSFNLSNENSNKIKNNRTPNYKNVSKFQEKNKEKENEKDSIKNEKQDNFLVNLTNLTKKRTDKDNDTQNKLNELDENLEVINSLDNTIIDKNNLNKENKINKNENKNEDNNNVLNYSLAAVTFENDNEFINKNLIYIDKINDSMANYCGIGYQLNNKNIGVFFNDHTQLLKIYNNNNYLLYFDKGFLSNIPYTKRKIELPIKIGHNNMTKKLRFLIRIMQSFILNKNKEGQHNEEIINEDEEYIILEKYKSIKNISLFILSNKNIQVNFNDRTKIIFVCSEYKKIIYIDDKDERTIIPIKNNNFNNFKCDEDKIKRKINFAIKQLNK